MPILRAAGSGSGIAFVSCKPSTIARWISRISIRPSIRIGSAGRGRGKMAAGADFRGIWTIDDFDADECEAPTDRNLQASKVIDPANEVHGASMRSHLSFMAVRLRKMRRTLKDGGSFDLHCDPEASRHLRSIKDALFQKKGLQNEIVWCLLRPRWPLSQESFAQARCDPFPYRRHPGPAVCNKPSVPSTSQKNERQAEGGDGCSGYPCT